MGWQDDPELGFGKQEQPVVVDPPVEPKPRVRPTLVSPALLTAQSLVKLGSVALKSKPAYVGLPCFTC